MKNLSKILFAFLIIAVNGCNSELQSPQILCFSPPVGFGFEIVDKTTGADLFANGTYQSDQNQIAILDLASNSKIPYTLATENGIYTIRINSIGWKTEKINYSISINEKYIFGLYVDASRISDNHCSYTKFNEILIKNSEFEFNQNTGIYKILVP